MCSIDGLTDSINVGMMIKKEFKKGLQIQKI